ncbi:MAG TPA: class I adenylate-forming enzyme family protein [Flexivirga sp.]|uniref:class I adenylate-forming enzyme family protein n=1 Tax=Flexivirga sp. TaxID=1962927 RepID=UPI002D09FC30|nr:class I adenylate-forming enzyme family protein [Flexivirga sp.]HWC23324.1 class I adenylate-forming enzyme family protein [Flexivirga sp.]
MSLPAGAGNRIVTSGYAGTWADLPPWPELPRASAVLAVDNTTAVRAVWQHATDGDRETLITSDRRVDPTQAAQFRAGGLATVTQDTTSGADPDHDAAVGRLWLLTSGSTGRPKQVAHTLDSLTTVTGGQPPRTWLCPYTTGAYAWWQVVTLSLTVPGQDIVFLEPGQLDSWPQLALEHGVTAASGTPTFWRQAMWRSGDIISRLPLEQVTLGGEPVDQGILDRLREAFPAARISWIYASSEAGAAIAVHDGRAGFPRSWLDRQTPDRPLLSVEDDELVIASPHAAHGMPAAIHTGDRVELSDDRVAIVGRIASDEINVGGSKASGSSVRRRLLDHPDVVWAAVRGRKAPLVGQVVVADVVLADDAAATTGDLTSWCAEELPDYSVPRRLRVLPEIPIKESLKSDV